MEKAYLDERRPQIPSSSSPSFFGVCILEGSDFVFSLANDCFLEMFGIQEAEIIGRKASEVLPRPMLEILETVFATGITHKRIDKKTADTENFWINFDYRPKFDAHRRVTGVMVVGEPAIEENGAARYEDERELQSLFMQAPAAIAVVEGPHQKYVLANSLYQKLIGRTEEQLLGKAMREIFPEVTGQGIFEILENVYSSGKAYSAAEFPVAFNRDGNHKQLGYYNFVAKPIRGSNPNARSILILAFDVTEQVITRKKIEQNEKQLQLITDAVPSLVSYVDKNCIYQFNNKAYEQWFGYPASTIRGKHMSEVLGAKAYEKLRPKIEQVLTGERVHFEMLAPYSDGGQRYILADYIPHRQNDEVIGFYVVVNDITRRRKAERETRESERRFRLMANAIPEVIWVANAWGQVTFINKRWEEFSGHSFEALSTEDMTAKFVHPEDAAAVTKAFRNSFETGKPMEIEQRYRSASGEYRWFLNRGVPYYNSSTGALESWFGIGIDIHERKLFEDVLSAAEQRFRTLVETLPQMVWMRNMDGKIEFASKNWELYSGIADISEAWRTMTHPDDWDAIMTIWEKALESRTSFQYEVRLKNKEGEYRWHFATGVPVKDESGQVTKFIGALTDIHIQKTFTEKLESQVARRTVQLQSKNKDLETTQSFLQQLIDSSVEYISVFDKNLNFITVNRRFEDTMALGRKALQGRHLFEITPEVKDTVQHKSLLNALQGETVYLDKRPSAARPDMYVDTYFVPLHIDESVAGVIVMARDVTAIVHTEKTLQKINEELQRSNEDLQQFAHVASHDLKEPVRKIKTFLSRLKTECGDQLSLQANEFVSKMEKAADRIYTMIDGVLRYSSIGTIQGSFQRVNLQEIMDSIVADTEVLIEQKKRPFSIRICRILKVSPYCSTSYFTTL
jgi:PAS domain S-box-containing protein